MSKHSHWTDRHQANTSIGNAQSALDYTKLLDMCQDITLYSFTWSSFDKLLLSSIKICTKLHPLLSLGSTYAMFNYARQITLSFKNKANLYWVNTEKILNELKWFFNLSQKYYLILPENIHLYKQNNFLYIKSVRSKTSHLKLNSTLFFCL